MSATVWLAADALGWPEGGGHLWAYLNWALGLRAAGCKVVWLEAVDPNRPVEEIRSLVATLKGHLSPCGMADCVAICSRSADPLPAGAAEHCLDIAGAAQADLLLDLSYASCVGAFGLFGRTALVDIDPGLLQVWLHEKVIELPPHDAYFTIGETVGQPGGRIPDGGLKWHYTPPCVALDWWPPAPASANAPFTTVSQWSAGEWVTYKDESYNNSKRTGFLPFLELPRHTAQPLELALCLAADREFRLDPDEEIERQSLLQRGWRVCHAQSVASSPWDYRSYIQRSRGEFSCAKPSCSQFQNAWISDRTLCYLASGKPAVVQHTGPSRFLPDAAGLFRFRTLEEAAASLEAVAADYPRQCRLARALAEEHFDARKVAAAVVERALR